MIDYIQTIVVVLISLYAFYTLLTVQKKNAQLRREMSQQKHLLDTIKNDVYALFTGAVGEDARLHKLETRTRRIIERQEQLENNKQSERPYEQAIRMVHQGSTVKDLMAVCNLSKGEADLIMMVHGESKSDSDASGQYH